MGKKFSKNLKIKVVQEKPNEITLVLPSVLEGQSINDKDLQQITGSSMGCEPLDSGTNAAGLC